MRILIAGGTGFVGSHLVQHFLKKSESVTVLGRSTKKIADQFPDKITPLEWNKLTLEDISSFDLIINLAGTNIGEGRWSKKRKASILQSRIEATEILSNFCKQLGEESPALFNASAIGVYGLQETSNALPKAMDETLTIDFNTSSDFLSKVGRAWELATKPATDAGARVVNMRFGVVIDWSGGVLKKMAAPFYFGMGGKVGSGNQAFSWIALSDLIRAIDFLIEHQEIKGPVNFVSPECIQQKVLAKAIAKALHRPCFFTAPAFMLKLAFGEMAEELLLKGQHVYPKRLLDAGFVFERVSVDKGLVSI